jgi:anti-sigma B factor antagonist
MSLNIVGQEQDGISVLSLDGKLVMGQECADLQTTLESLIHSGHTRIILDCRQVSTIDEAGVGTIVEAITKVREVNGKLAIAELQSSHLQLLELMRLEEQLPLYADRQSAINSFFPGRQTGTYDVLSFVRSISSRNDPESAGSA